MTEVRLALGGPPEACAKGGLSVRPGPSILVSYFYIEQAFNRYRERLVFRDWVMDSGAYSAHNSGGAVSLDAYIEECKKREDDPQLTEVFALDVIGDYKASLVNTERMWKEGVKAIPCYHVGEPWDVLTSLARDYPKIALGGAVGLRSKVKMDWAKECFARVWPKKIHGFGFGGEKMILSYPFHSVDATNWELGPTKFGSWKRFGNMSVRGGQASGGHNLRCEVEWYMKLESHAKQKWAKEMALLDGITHTQQPRRQVALIGCGAAKQATPQAARTLYKGVLFKLGLEYVMKHRAQFEAVYVLSALHGLVGLDQVIAPYNHNMNDKTQEEKNEWGMRVVQQLSRHSDIDLVCYAGHEYAQPLQQIGVEVHEPLANMRMGYRMQWLKETL